MMSASTMPTGAHATTLVGSHDTALGPHATPTRSHLSTTGTHASPSGGRLLGQGYTTLSSALFHALMMFLAHLFLFLGSFCSAHFGTIFRTLLLSHELATVDLLLLLFLNAFLSALLMCVAITETRSVGTPNIIILNRRLVFVPYRELSLTSI
ncbi:MAG: hypothetical protein JRF62_13660 [Deltaproteobacteria bacterium]|nr:hypothetical protein [Deltaproteobacteria bacterium]